MNILVDAFGGDNAPNEIVKGCEMAVSNYGVKITLIGDERKIKRCIEDLSISPVDISIRHAPDVIPMDAEPSAILKQYYNSSMAMGLRLLSENGGDAFVSAGNTGALAVGTSMIVKRLNGIKRVCLGTLVPFAGGCYMLMDVGANVECRPEMLVQFGVMGSIYMEKIMGINKPSVGLVNIGAEETKGTPLQIEAYKQLSQAPLHFIGNIEARDMPFHKCDVAVTDGFTGNVLLKLTEGLGMYFAHVLKEMFGASAKTKLGALLVKKSISKFKKSMDYSEYGGAPFLGASGVVIKAHGSSNAKAIMNAVRQASQCCKNAVPAIIEERMRSMKESRDNRVADGEE